MQLVSAGAMEPPAGRDPATTIKNAQVALWNAIHAADPAQYVRGQYDGYHDDRRCRRRTPPPRRTWRCAWTSTTGAGPACRSSSVPASGCRSTQTELRLIFRNHRGSACSLPGDRVPEPDRAGGAAGPDHRHPADRLDAHRGYDARARAAINLDMDFATRAARAGAVRGAAARRADRQPTRFTRQDGVEEAWRIMQPLLDNPPPVQTYQPGSWGPAAADQLVAAYGGWREPWTESHDRDRERARDRPRCRATHPAAVAVPEDRRLRVPVELPHRCAGRADGSVDWLCVPRFDSPSIFGSLLDREAGTFRFGPYGIDHPTTRIYVPGTNVLETTWQTPTGWIVVRDALTMGPHDTDDCVTPHTRPPTD